MQGGELLAEDELLKGELGADAEHGAQAGEQAEQQGKHGQVAHNAMSVLRSLCIRALTDGGAALRTRTWRTARLVRGQRDTIDFWHKTGSIRPRFGLR